MTCMGILRRALCLSVFPEKSRNDYSRGKEQDTGADYYPRRVIRALGLGARSAEGGHAPGLPAGKSAAEGGAFPALAAVSSEGGTLAGLPVLTAGAFSEGGHLAGAAAK